MNNYALWLRGALHGLPHLDFAFRSVDNIFVFDFNDAYTAVSERKCRRRLCVTFNGHCAPPFAVAHPFFGIRARRWRAVSCRIGHNLARRLLRVERRRRQFASLCSPSHDHIIFAEYCLFVSLRAAQKSEMSARARRRSLAALCSPPASSATIISRAPSSHASIRKCASSTQIFTRRTPRFAHFDFCVIVENRRTQLGRSLF